MIRCPQCNRRQPNEVLTCDCGYDLQTYRLQVEERKQISMENNQAYAKLPIFRTALTIFAWLTILGGIVSAISIYGQEENIWFFLGALISGLIVATLYFAGAETITAVLDINARQEKIQQRLDRLEENKK